MCLHVALCYSIELRTALVGVGIVIRSGTHYHLDKGNYCCKRVLFLPNPCAVDSYNMTRFLNRILGLPVGLQNKLFNYFTDTLGALIQQAKRMGKWDNGILGKKLLNCDNVLI